MCTCGSQWIQSCFHSNGMTRRKCGYIPALFVQCVCDGLQGEGAGRLGVGPGMRKEGGEGEVRDYHLA